MGQLSSAQARVRLAEINLKQAREEVTAAEDALQVVRDGVSKSNARCV